VILAVVAGLLAVGTLSMLAGALISAVLVRVPIFEDSIENEHWEHGNHGLKNLQVRFYPGVPTDVSEADVNLKPLP
jgi:hypothetical protein